ncbi:MAG: ATP-dependent DNA helicase RecG [Lachnospiraceae bacterium]|nr:ATP-dependent DNA helicase RecG [Lachnospiraceae bacterium]
MHESLRESMTGLKGVGDKTARLFAQVGVHTVGELLLYYPRDYDIYGEIMTIDEASRHEGEVVAVKAMLVGEAQLRFVKKLSILTLHVADVTGQLKVTLFNMPYMKSSLKTDRHYVIRGLMQKKGAQLFMEQPRVTTVENYEEVRGTMQPKYPLTKGLTNNAVTKAMKQAVAEAVHLEETLPDALREKRNLIGICEAVRKIHFPLSMEDFFAARRRLSYQEFYDFIYRIRTLKSHEDALKNGYPCIEVAECRRLIEALPYPLTNAQKKVWEEICRDLTGARVMNRLVQGDVGSGKTILAFLSLLMVAVNGYQGAIMAPTEVLARQHIESFKELIAAHDLPLNPVLLVGSLSAKEKREVQEGIADGTYNLIVGTNALIQEKVSYQNLALVITDEQHRFGVRQRDTLAEKGGDVFAGVQPHVLSLSATPIPRTLAIVLYGDLSVSILDEKPANRLPVKNAVVNTDYRATAYKFIAKEVAAQHQVYVICPMIEEGEMEGVENVVSYAEKLKAALPNEVRIEILHGQMKPAVKDEIMSRFLEGNIDVLVSTTVVEVGVNVPNATVMMVENAEHFGLAQLHQLRGRVGRGDAQSYCVFINSSKKEEAAARLEILKQSNDGFKIAEEDLKQRGPGELFGVRQSGELAFRVGDIYRDSELLKMAAGDVDEILVAN